MKLAKRFFCERREKSTAKILSCLGNFCQFTFSSENACVLPNFPSSNSLKVHVGSTEIIPKNTLREVFCYSNKPEGFKFKPLREGKNK